jgi:hypothetical protein
MTQEANDTQGYELEDETDLDEKEQCNSHN